MTAFVVLHYMAYDMTRRCVDTILENFGAEDIRIIVVDNASSNGSGQKLKKDFFDNAKVSVLLNEENKGFARGNNTGYRYAIKEYDPDYIIVMNNDVIIRQRSFLKRIEAIHEKTHFAVLGPDIINPYEKKHQNPVGNELMSLETAEKVKRSRRIRRVFPYPFFIKDAIMEKLGRRKKAADACCPAILHGACYIFSREFTAVRKYAFNPGTFLYLEEEILGLECQKARLKLVYSPDVRVLHYEDVATDMVCRKALEKYRMHNEESLRSLDVYISLLKEERV